ncbi:glycosyltransferase family 61 protein [Leptolyngbya cf. ectocarpi LEGE 11479]|uniref:Glycosyltransferase family 61 protein n=1 Tax=Leptolyngbya cf. ectocarpi LEGE 11479 TaxID=1828722 RepID=A0A928ZX61_LEPEC|nr:glycosyltransferase family 61 protein [Leptolyngbya ectocarpi]MBE9069074.1 glycosyltransferase family 61 protein [Leptolyngbya cf. ectocarpi LEGE 11479]
MNKKFYQEIPGFKVAPSMLFGFPTGTINTWAPSIEQILLPEESTPPTQFQVEVHTGEITFQSLGPKRKLYHAVAKRFRGEKKLDYSGKFIFDARWDTYKNLSHIIDLAAVVLFARKVLRENLQEKIDIHVILDSGALKYDFVKDMYSSFGIPLISTDDTVCGEVVTVSPSPHKLYTVKPQLFDIDFPGYKKMGFDKVFIPRRGNRGLSNNDEVTEFLTKKGFQTCYFEDFSVAEKWSIIRDAKVIVAVHGAAVNNIIFNRLGLQENARFGSGIKVIELISPGWIDYGFRELATVFNGKWCGVRGQITPKMLEAVDFSEETPTSLKSPYKDDFKIDCRGIQAALDYVQEP